MRSAVVLFISFICSGASLAFPVAPGHHVSIYAAVTDPVRLSFAPSGVLYVGRDNSGSGGGPGDAVRIHRVEAGGVSVSEYGLASIVDPDAVLYDGGGLMGVAGEVLVGGQISNASGGHLTAILPNMTVTTLFGPTTAFHNPTDFVIDGSNRVLFTNAANSGTSSPGVYWTTGALPTALFTTSSRPLSVAVDSANRIFTTFTDGTLRIYSDTGVLIDGAFATGLGSGTPMTIGSLGSAPEAVYVVNAVGELVRIEISGTQTVIGSAFTDASDLEFGPDGALYVSEFNNDDILRVAAAPPAAVPGLHGLMPLGVLIAGLSASVLAIGGGRIPRR